MPSGRIPGAGVDGKSGFKDLTTENILSWSYDSVSDELMAINDFESVFFEDYEKNWIRIMDEIIEKHGSWETRRGYKRWHLMEVA